MSASENYNRARRDLTYALNSDSTVAGAQVRATLAQVDVAREQVEATRDLAAAIRELRTEAVPPQVEHRICEHCHFCATPDHQCVFP